jgi:hypothetical protein
MIAAQHAVPLSSSCIIQRLKRVANGLMSAMILYGSSARGRAHVLDWIHGWISGPNFKFDLNWIQQPNLDC